MTAGATVRVPVVAAVRVPVKDLLGDGVHALLTVMVDADNNGVDSTLGRRHGSATPPVENAAGTAV